MYASSGGCVGLSLVLGRLAVRVAMAGRLCSF